MDLDIQISELLAEAEYYHERISALEAALAVARTLVEKLEAVHADPRYQAVWMNFMIHGGRYTEPTYTKEFEAAKLALNKRD